MKPETLKLSKEIKKTILLNPGPSTTTESVKLSLLREDICHREKEFTEVVKQVTEDLVRIVHGKKEDYAAVLFAGSGSLCIDSAISSLVPQGGKVMIVNNGFYNSRALEVCRCYGIPAVDCSFGILELPDPAIVEKTLRENADDVALVYMAHQETGTGLCNPVREVGAIAHKYGKIFVTDTTSTLGMIPIDVYRDNIDFCMASSQKGINAIPGCSFIIGRRDYIEKTKDFPKRSYYTNLWREYSHFKEHGEMHFTPPVQIIFSMQQALKEHFEEGEEAKYRRLMTISDIIREETAALGLQELLPREKTTGLVAAIRYPEDENFDFMKVHDYLYERGITIYQGKIDNLPTFRICNLGCNSESDIRYAFRILREALEACGTRLPDKT